MDFNQIEDIEKTDNAEKNVRLGYNNSSPPDDYKAFITTKQIERGYTNEDFRTPVDDVLIRNPQSQNGYLLSGASNIIQKDNHIHIYYKLKKYLKIEEWQLLGFSEMEKELAGRNNRKMRTVNKFMAKNHNDSIFFGNMIYDHMQLQKNKRQNKGKNNSETLITVLKGIVFRPAHDIEERSLKSCVITARKLLLILIFRAIDRYLMETSMSFF